MDFSPTQEQEDIRALAARIFGDLVAHAALPDFEDPQDWFDERLWIQLAESSLLGIGIPEEFGGAGMGLVEACTVLEEAGRNLAPVPLLPALLLGAAPIVEFGTTDQRRRLLPEISSGRAIVTAALLEPGARSPATIGTTARSAEGDWVLDGVKAFVPAASRATHILLPARTEDRRLGVFVLESASAGISLTPQATTTGDLEYMVTLEGVRVAQPTLLGNSFDGDRIVSWLYERALAGLCALELGIAERALRMTAEYTASRRQFGKPIATFQAVAQRAADAYVDLEAMRLATQQAIWRLASGLDASRELAIAKFWAAEGGHRVCYAAQHLHGGIGVDTDYPLHRYYLRSRQIELTLGAAHTHLAWLGERLAGKSG
jgi:alkylation response protein AidB-like acyl-CoA dehydrogenase